MDKRPYDLWAEVPSPIKTRLRNAFTAYAEECFQKDGILLKAYVPAQVGGNTPKEEYLKGMKPEDLPDACFLMDFASARKPPLPPWQKRLTKSRRSVPGSPR